MSCTTTSFRFYAIWFSVTAAPAASFEFLQEGVDVLELPIDRSKADIRHLIHLSQLFESKLADSSGACLAFQRIFKFLLNLVYNLLKRL